MNTARRLGAAIAIATLALALGSATASAATRVGTECTASAVTSPNMTLVQYSSAGPLPVKAPAGGVVTSWRIKMSLAEPDAMPVRLKVLRLAGESNPYEVLAESAYEVAVNGVNVFPARIPVGAGVQAGLTGSPSAGRIECVGGGTAQDVLARIPGNPAVGTSQLGVYTIGAKSPVAMDVEPDVDGDGYGDETQDLCPVSAAVQGPCPVPAAAPPAPKVDAEAIARRGSLLVLAATDSAASVAASGSVRVPGTQRGKAGKRVKRTTVVRLASRSRSVGDGELARLVVPYPGKLKRTLRKLPPMRRLTLRLSLSASNAGGRTTETLRVKLPGQRKAKRGKSA